MKHDPACELQPRDLTCRCAERAYLVTATEEELIAWVTRTGYDRNNREARP